MKVLGAQNTSYLATQTIPFWERKYVVWYICLLSPAGRPASVASPLWHMVKSSPCTQSQTKARDTRTPRGSCCLWPKNTVPGENVTEVNQKWTLGRSLPSSGSQAKNLTAPVKPLVHPTMEAKGSAASVRGGCILHMEGLCKGPQRGTAAGGSQHQHTDEHVQGLWPDKTAHFIPKVHLTWTPSSAPEGLVCNM